MIKSLIRKIDFLGGDIKLLYKGNDGPRSILGGLISIILGIIISLLIIEFGQDFFYRLNPYIYVQDVNPLEYKKFNITNKDLPMSFRFENSDATLIDKDEIYFSFDVYHSIYERNSEGLMKLIKSNNLNYKLCNENDFVDNEDIFKSRGLQNTYCIDYGNLTHLEFGGDWDVMLFIFIW